MSIQEQLKTALSGVAGGRIFPHIALEGVTKPYVTYFRLSVIPETTLSSGRPLENTIFQLDIYDKTAAGASATKDAVKAALDAWAVQSVIQSEQDLYEPDTRLHRVTMDVSVWS
jgi:hypothetical protein